MDNKPLIFICSKFRGKVAINKRLAKSYCKFATAKEVIPFAPHLYFTQFLADADPKQRQIGIDCGKAVLLKCQELWAFVVNGEISEGMRQEIEFAFQHGVPVKWFAVDQGAGNYTHLPHLPHWEWPKAGDLLTANANVSKIDNLFAKMESELKKGDTFYEDFEQEMDEILGTSMSERDRETEENWARQNEE